MDMPGHDCEMVGARAGVAFRRLFSVKLEDSVINTSNFVKPK